MSEYEDGRVESRSNLVNTASTIVLIAMFAISALVLLSAGLQVYKKVVLAANENFELRTSLSYVATKIREADSTGMVEVVNYDGVDVLVLGEYYGDERYNTMIFFEDGVLYEFMQAAEEEPFLDYGFETMEIDNFSIKQDGNMILLSASNAEGAVENLAVAIRSGR